MNDMIDIHADDYGLSVNTSKEMLEFLQDGVFDSISIITNNTCYEQCMDMLKKKIPALPFLPKMSVHLNLVEGYYLSDPGRMINASWKDLFLASFLPGRKKRVSKLLEKEISAQLKKGWDGIKACIDIAKKSGVKCEQEKIRVDSHQHTHMIPVVWESLQRSLQNCGFEAEYIRNSREPLSPFISEVSLWQSYRLVNIIKNRILRFMSRPAERYDRKNGHEPMYLWGLVMSGNMDADRIGILYRRMTDTAKAKNRRLEILFHPGRMTKDECSPEIPKDAAESFYLSDGRDIEKEGARFTLSQNLSAIK